MSDNSLPPELTRRKGATQRIYDLFCEKPQEWIGVHELASVGGFAAWRTRVSDARALAARDGYEILWNGSTSASKYMLRPLRLGRDASTPIEQKVLF